MHNNTGKKRTHLHLCVTRLKIITLIESVAVTFCFLHSKKSEKCCNKCRDIIIILIVRNLHIILSIKIFKHI